VTADHPTPFNQSAAIKYQLPRLVEAGLSADGVIGREVSVLVTSTNPTSSTVWDSFFWCRLQYPFNILFIVLTRRVSMIIRLSGIGASMLVALLFHASSVVAQDAKLPAHTQLSRDSLLTLARVIMDSAQCHALATVDEGGKPHVRSMSPFPPEKNMVIWLGTFRNSRKVKQIQKNPNVVVYYYDAKGFSFVSLSGKARIVDDADKKAKYWKQGWEQFYPDREKNYILIEVTPERLEMVSFKYGLLWEPTTGVPVASIDFGRGGAK
jgi:general stress protein 26